MSHDVFTPEDSQRSTRLTGRSPDRDARVIDARVIDAPADISHGYLYLPGKPSAGLAYSRLKSLGDSDISNVTVLFLNGLILPKSVWLPVMTAILDSLRTLTNSDARPEMVAYDRFGQGLSEPDPRDRESGKEPGYGHGVMDVVADLDDIISQTQMGQTRSGSRRRLVFVASSIGCAFARLYAQSYPDRVSGIVFLDSMMANENFIDMFPDPASPDFDPSALPDGITPSILADQRQKFRRKFAPDVVNGEGLDRRNLAELLPRSDGPTLTGPGAKPPFLTVVGHDRETFARLSLEGEMKTPIAFTENYTQPVWDRYNEGLLRLSDTRRATGVIIAHGCGHFIPSDDPKLSANLAIDLIHKLFEKNTEI